MPSISKFIPVASLILTIGTTLFVLDQVGFGLTLPASTPIISVVLGALVASAASIWAASRLRLVAIASQILHQPQPASETLDDLIGVAKVARTEGLLIAAVDPRSRRHPLLRSGIQLLARDADDRLVRSTLETEADYSARRVGAKRALIARSCSIATAILVVAAAAAAILMGSLTSSPWSVGLIPAAAILGTVTAFFAWHAIADPIASLLYRRNAADAFSAAAVTQTILALNAGEDAQQLTARLHRLLPEPALADVTDTRIRAAA